jgi:hypothetical protein
MRRSSFSPGTVVKIEGRQFTLAHPCSIEGQPHWAMVDENGMLVHRSMESLKQLYDVTRTLEFVSVEAAQGKPGKKRAALV